MRKISKLAAATLAVASLLFAAGPGLALAYSPSLSVSNEGSDSVRVTVSGAQPFSSVSLYRQASGSSLWDVITNVGTTDGSGYFSQTISLGPSSYYGANYYATVGPDRTPVVYPGGSGGGCTYNCGSPYGISLSQSNVSLNQGQTSYVSIYGGSGSYYVSSGNTGAVTASVSGSQLSLYGNYSGSASVTVCSSGSSGCASVYVSVSGSGYVGGITVSETNVSLSVGQSRQVTVSQAVYLQPSFYVSSNSNSSVVSASLSGSTLNLSAQAAGSSTVTVCTSSNGCASVYVTVTGSGCGYYGCGGNVSLSQSNVSLNQGQTSYVSIYGGSGSYYVSSGNTGAVTASVSGSQLSLYGNYSGSASVTVCSNTNTGSCASVYVTVSGGSGCGYYGCGSGTTNVNIQDFYFSPSTVTVSPGTTVTWRNNGSMNHTVTADGGAFSSGTMGPGATYTYTFSTPGTYTYRCTIHPGMTATVVVSGYYGGYYGGSPVLPQTLPTATLNQSYGYQINPSGGQAPYTYQVVSGSLPGGLSLSTSGYLSGYVSQQQTATFGIRVTDAAGRTDTKYYTFSTSGYFGGGVLGTSTYRSGQLISENGTVYMVYRGQKTPFSNRAAFEGFGFRFWQVSAAGYTGLPTSGYTITTSRASHPWGSWIKSGSTVYFVHESGLVPVPSADVFTANGGQWSLVVPANAWDFQLPMLSVMSYGDSRLY